MIRNVLVWLFGFVIVALLIVWVLNGGPKKIYDSVRSFSFNATTSDSAVLPWQPANPFPVIDVGEMMGTESGSGESDPYSQLEDLEREYQALVEHAEDVMKFGNPSPNFRKVRILTVSNSENASESVELSSGFDNTAPVSLAGWSLQSALTGARVFIPSASSPFLMGAVNTVSPVSLAPGESALFISAPSPVGISFRDNICTGYLSQFQSFSPELSLWCPSSYDDMPLTQENLERYGAECIDHARTLPICHFPQQVPASLSPSCRSFLQTTFSYNGCVNLHRNDYNFQQDPWRLFLGSAQNLWRDEHDAIRLLDADGQVVDVYTY